MWQPPTPAISVRGQHMFVSRGVKHFHIHLVIFSLESDEINMESASSRTNIELPMATTNFPVTKKILVLDGGGVRGLSALTILEHLMKVTSARRGVDLIHPWQEFDMIA